MNQCCADVRNDFGVGYHRCQNNGKVERDGKWFCGIHDPVKVAERRAKIDEKARSQYAIDGLVRDIGYLKTRIGTAVLKGEPFDHFVTEAREKQAKLDELRGEAE